MDLMFQPYRKYVDFEGRARRAEFWLFTLFNLILIVIFETVAGVGKAAHEPVLQTVGLIATLAVFLVAALPWLAVRIRRLHDMNLSGWWIFLGAVPFIGGLILIILCLIDGTPDRNRFGPDPKGRGSSASTPAVLNLFS